MHGHGINIVIRADIPGYAGIGVEGDVASDGVVIARRRVVGESEASTVAEIVPADADVTHVRVALLVATSAGGGTVIGDHPEVDIRLCGPLLSSFAKHILPGL